MNRAGRRGKKRVQEKIEEERKEGGKIEDVE